MDKKTLGTLVNVQEVLGPQVVMTAPSEGFTISIGDSILVTADITSSGGIATVDFRGNYAGASDPAFVAESQTGGGVEFLSVTNRLRAAVGQVAGEAYVVVQATDLSGGIGVDSVKVTIN